MAKKKPTFEEALARLEDISDLLESGDALLADSVKLYKEGVALAAECAKVLDAAEADITLLRKDDSGAFTLAPFAEDDHDV